LLLLLLLFVVDAPPLLLPLLMLLLMLLIIMMLYSQPSAAGGGEESAWCRAIGIVHSWGGRRDTKSPIKGMTTGGKWRARPAVVHQDLRTENQLRRTSRITIRDAKRSQVQVLSI
jgi:hypothetical protein